VRLLYENSLPENKYYQYDFFYDNCSTRILEILNKATKEQIDWGLSQFSEEYSFRDIIDIYLENQEWTDLGIDLALGLPCDKILEPGDQAFLPDSFQVMCSSAKVNGVNLVKNCL